MTVEVFAPASVTTVFAPQDGAGSLGVSAAVADGVTAAVEPAATTQLTLADDPVEMEAVTHVLDALGVSVTVALESDVPIGCGFGVSGAATLATALGAAAVEDLDTSRADLVEAAHRAELAAGTGQGDVYIQDAGGLVYNTGAGLERREREDPLAYSSFGPIDTAAVLAEDTDHIATAGRTALDAFDPDMPLGEWFPTAWRFAEAIDVTTDRVRATVADVTDAGGAATMAMLGETVVGTPDTDVLSTTTHIDPTGAHRR
ncbi:MAG: GHMP kinase [Halobacteriaceae archaeon]